MQKTTYFMAMLTAGMFVTTTPLHAQVPGRSPENAQYSSPHSLPAVQTPEPLHAAEFPYKKQPLRDPFWQVGYFPTEWGIELQPQKQKEVSDSEWQIPTSQLEVSGVSRMGSRVLAIVNNELKKVGDIVEITYLGKVFQWKVGEIQADGNVRFERHQIINESR